MSPDVKDFYGKDVASAMKEACKALGVAQENLNIEVVETGSAGIFGLIRRKAHIRVTIQGMEAEAAKPAEAAKAAKATKAAKPVDKTTPKKSPESISPDQVEQPGAAETTKDEPPDVPDTEPVSENTEIKQANNHREVVELSAETLALINTELGRILELMGCPSSITVKDIDGTAHCNVSSDHEELLVSQEGRTLDSLQYLLRKIVSKKLPGRVQLDIDVGNYRERRYQELQELALEYSGQVKENGKTQVISSLNPSERRVVHVALQDDPDIRSRSIGEGLFKKVLIYKPGKGRSNNNRKRPRGKYRKKGNTDQSNDESK
jgi:spoIIIJ-associated protein